MSAPRFFLPSLLTLMLLTACEQPVGLHDIGQDPIQPLVIRAHDAPHEAPPVEIDRLRVAVDVFDSEGEPLGWVEVCAWERPEVLCATTGADGRVWLDGPGKSIGWWTPYARLTVVAERPGFAPTIKTGVIEDDGTGHLDLTLLRAEEPAEMLDPVHHDPDPHKGLLKLTLSYQHAPWLGVAGIAVRDSHGRGVGPFYENPEGVLKTGYVRTTERGVAVIADLPAGTAEIRLANERPFACSADGAAPGSDDRGLVVLMVPGAVTEAHALCVRYPVGE